MPAAGQVPWRVSTAHPDHGPCGRCRARHCRFCHQPTFRLDKALKLAIAGSAMEIDMAVVVNLFYRTAWAFGTAKRRKATRAARWAASPILGADEVDADP
ncbi:hypothetical protein KCP71_16035 [Salmonella enterica subsp. enterica]|nr:hypothetical protein KCP71_16035 [Salmonella enterica subsp. enterica]